MSIRIDASVSNEWHVLRGKDQFGPYTYEQMISLMQQKKLFSFDYIWSPHLQSWKQLGNLSEFSSERLAALAKKNPHQGIFIHRAHPRVPCSWSGYVHDDKRVYQGKIESISIGGALVLIDSPRFMPGDFLTVHVAKSTEINIPFNARGEVLSKRHNSRNPDSPAQIYYTFKFHQVQSIGINQINAFIKAQLESPNLSKDPETNIVLR